MKLDSILICMLPTGERKRQRKRKKKSKHPVGQVHDVPQMPMRVSLLAISPKFSFIWLTIRDGTSLQQQNSFIDDG
jgi:hypothetical protein